MNTLAAAPAKTRIVMLDACRNNPFSEVNKVTGRGLAIVDAPGGSILSYATAPGTEAEDGTGVNSPYTSALVVAAKEPGLPIEETFKRVRLSVNKTTEGRQTPWDSSSLTEDFRFSGGSAAGAAVPRRDAAKRSVEEWRRELNGKPVELANEMIVGDGTDEAYEAFAGLYAQTPFGLQARDWLDRHRRMVAWNIAVITNTAAGYRKFLAQYPNSDLTATAAKLEERLRNRPDSTPAVVAVAAPAATPQNASLVAPTCPCNTQPQPLKRVDAPIKKVDPDPPKRADRKPPRRVVEDEDVVVVGRPPTVYYEPAPPPPRTGIGIGIGIGGGYYGGGNYGSPPVRQRGGY
jgi:hypothetical protein